MSMTSIAVLCFAALMVAPSTLAEFSFGFCPNKPVVAVTDAAVQAVWSEDRRYFDLAELDNQCTKITVSAAASPHPTTIRSLSTLFNNIKTSTGTINVPSNGIVDLSMVSGLLNSYSRRYSIVAADSTSAPTVMVLWACTNVPFGNVQNSWVLTKVGSTVTEATISTQIANAGLILSKYIPLSTTCAA